MFACYTGTRAFSNVESKTLRAKWLRDQFFFILKLTVLFLFEISNFDFGYSSFKEQIISKKHEIKLIITVKIFKLFHVKQRLVGKLSENLKTHSG